MIELKHIKKDYVLGDNVVEALNDINLKIDDGEFVTIIGPSGSGKSTLMNMIGCLDKPTAGEYLVDGKEISNYSEKQLAELRNKKMGFIFQGFNLINNLSAYENVELPLIYQGISASERKKRVNEVVNLVGMKDRLKHKPSELSGGQQQRVAIARALAAKPMMILADEPTGNLDSATGEEIIKILNELNKSGTTIILITHNDEIAKLSRRVIRIFDGKIESDTINDSENAYGYKPEIQEESSNEIAKIQTSAEINESEHQESGVSENSTESVDETEVKTQIEQAESTETTLPVEETVNEKPIKKPVRKTDVQENKIIIKSKKNKKGGE